MQSISSFATIALLSVCCLVGCVTPLRTEDRAKIDIIFDEAQRYEILGDERQRERDRDGAILNYRLAADSYSKASIEYHLVLQNAAASREMRDNFASLLHSFLIGVAEGVYGAAISAQSQRQQRDWAQGAAIAKAQRSPTPTQTYYKELNKSYADMKKYGSNYEYKSLPDLPTAPVGAVEEEYARMALRSNRAFIRVEGLIVCYEESGEDELQKCLEKVRSAALDSAPPSMDDSEKYVVIEGGYCNESNDCVRGLVCSDHVCKQSKDIQRPTVPPKSKSASTSDNIAKEAGVTPLPAVREVDSDVSWMWPAAGTVVQPFKAGKSKGLIIVGKLGDPVLAAADGEVVYVGSALRGYRNLVLLRHDATYLTAYCDNQTILVKEGQNVTGGQKIAEMGATGAGRVQIQFEIRKQGKPIDPLLLLPPR